MIYITFALFTCLEKGKVIVDHTYGKITVNYIFADEQACLKLDTGNAFLLHDDIINQQAFCFYKKVNAHDIYG